MKSATVFVALVIAACAGSATDTGVDPITPTPVGVDSCAVARPDLGGPATQADLSLFAYDANAPLNLQKTVENNVGVGEISAISYDSPAGGKAPGRLFIPLNRSSLRPAIILM